MTRDPQSQRWDSDLLDGFDSTEFVLPDAELAPGEPEGSKVVATLVRRLPSGQSRRAVLYLHGWNDYFFQAHVADALAELGYDFHALDLRRYGRSLRRGQLNGFITDLSDYAAEIDAAVSLVARDHDELVLMGHSTGGLIAALWAADHADQVRALVLNSPWLDLQGSAMVRTLGTAVVDKLGTFAPTSVLPLPDLGFNARTLHRSFEGEWDYDLELKATPSPPIRVGWLRAVRLGHQRVAAGLGLPMPVLVLASSSTDFSRRWHEGLRSADVVLDVEQIVTRATRLGRQVTIVRIEGGLHDLFLSPIDVRKAALDEVARWLQGYALPDPR